MREKNGIQLGVCPFCSGKVYEGILYTRTGPGLFFLTRLPKMHQFMSAKRLIREEGSVVLDGIYQTRVNHTEIKAYICRQCRMVISFYG